MLSFSISYPDLIKLPYFADLTQSKRRQGVKREAQRQGEDRVTLRKTLLYRPAVVSSINNTGSNDPTNLVQELRQKQPCTSFMPLSINTRVGWVFQIVLGITTRRTLWGIRLSDTPNWLTSEGMLVLSYLRTGHWELNKAYTHSKSETRAG
jgi:hypothetical protein